jgi:hypothetical protein
VHDPASSRRCFSLEKLPQVESSPAGAIRAMSIYSGQKIGSYQHLDKIVMEPHVHEINPLKAWGR